MSHWYGISFTEYVFECHCLSYNYGQIPPYFVILYNNNDDDNNDDDNNDNNDNDNNINNINKNNNNNDDDYDNKREILSLSAYLRTEDIGVHIVHISRVITTYTLE